MDEELKVLVSEHQQLRAMKQSCIDFEKKLGEKVTKFLESHLELEEGDNFSLVELILKARSKG